MENRIPFMIDFPIKVLDKSKKINFTDKSNRTKLFRRNIYYNKNHLMEKRYKIYLSLAQKISELVKKEYKLPNILNISVFGSSLYSPNPKDFDFLIITKRNLFSYQKMKLIIKENGKNIRYSVGISVKGIENLSKGVFDIKSKIPINFQVQVIYRTVISLFKRHVPIIGYDFVKNRKLLFNNIYGQVSDLLNNAYELYYLKNKELKLNNKKRAQKILSRLYEAVSYVNLLEKNTILGKFRRKIFSQIKNKISLRDAQKTFDDVFFLYQKKTSKLYKNSRDKGKILRVLLDDKLKYNIEERLENYWRYAGLPYQWIHTILDILSKYYYDEDLVIKRIRKKFPSIQNENSLDYSQKLKEFRKIKVKNLAKRIKRDISGISIADVGGRTDDFVEQILLLNKSIKKAYVTDLFSFTSRSKNPKINFVVQSSLTKIPFTRKSLDTIILSMVFHHLNSKYQKEMIKNLNSYLRNKGKIILIEDTYPEKTNISKCSRITKEFLSFKPSEKKKILYFYDWFGNRLMRNRDNINLTNSYKTMEGWKSFFEKNGMKQIRSEFIKENPTSPDIFPPKAIIVFQNK